MQGEEQSSIKSLKTLFVRFFRILIYLKASMKLSKNVTGFRYPIKTVVAVEGTTITVVTNYPLKNGKIDERSL